MQTVISYTTEKHKDRTTPKSSRKIVERSENIIYITLHIYSIAAKYIASTKIVKVIDNELHKQTLP